MGWGGQTVQELKSIAGIGDYTAGAIASIAFAKHEPLVDGNVVRVLSRLRMLTRDPKAQASVKQHWALAGALVLHASDPAALNQASPF
jgi:A/G-specific adenine glycosylase